MKKILLVTMALLLSFQLYPAGQAKAEEFTPDEKRVGNILRGVGEKIGMSWTPDSLRATTGYALGSLKDLLPDWWMFGSVPDTVQPNGIDPSQYVLSPEDFGKAVDVLKKSSDALVPDSKIQFFGDCFKPDLPLSYGQKYAKSSKDSNGSWYVFIGYDTTTTGQAGFYSINTADGKYFADNFDKLTVNQWSIYSNKYIPQDWSNNNHWGAYGTWESSNTIIYESSGYGDKSTIRKAPQPSSQCERKVASFEKPNVINRTIIDNTTNNNYTIIKEYPITIETTDPIKDAETPLNQPLPEEDQTKITSPPPPDRDGDGIPDDEDLYPDDPTNTPEPEPEPEDKPVGSSWWAWILKPLIKAIELIGDAVEGLVNLITGLAKAIADAIGAIFVPSDGFFDGYFSDIKGSWDSKIPITGQLSDFMSTVKNSTGDSSRPVIEIDLPPRYGGVKISVIDFSYFDQYRDWILNFIRFTAWFVFLKKLFARLPRIIGG